VQPASTNYNWNNPVQNHSPSHMAYTYPASNVPYPSGGGGVPYGMAMPQAGYYPT